MNTKNLILITGDEEYLKTEKKKEILSLLGAEGSPDFNVFSGKETDFSEVYDLSQTMPFFGKHRVLLFESTGLFKGNTEERILSIFSGIPDFTYVIFVEDSADAAGRLTKLFQKKGEVYTFSQVDSVKNYKAANEMRGDIKAWIRDYLKKEGCSIDRDAVEALTGLSGFNMLNLETELQKLISYSNGHITRDHIEEICSKTVQDRVFDMVDLKLSGNTKGALLLFEDMLSIRIEPMRIIYMLSRQFNQVFIIKELESRRFSDAQILSKTGLKDWQLRKLRDRSRGRSAKDMLQLVELCIDMETKIKTGDISDRLAAEIILCS